jgi:uncharacterized membrane protein HdeD (DUF308 family)
MEGDDMGTKAQSLATQHAPWRKGLGWPVLAIEGAVALGIGIYILVATDDARDIIRQLIAVVLLIQAFLHTMAGFRNRQLPAAPFHVLRGGIGMTVGVIVLLENFSDYLNVDAARFILGLGLIAYGAIGIVTIWVEREDRGLRLGGLAVGIVNIVLGLMFVFSDSAKDSWLRALGGIALVGGIILLGYAFMVYRSSSETPAAPPAPPAEVAPS